MTGVSDKAEERVEAETWLNSNTRVRWVKNKLRLRKRFVDPSKYWT